MHVCPEQTGRIKFDIMLRTWKVASQQCQSYDWEKSSTGVCMGIPEDGIYVAIGPQAWRLGNKLGDEMWDLKSTGIFLISIRGQDSDVFMLKF
ncbi:hypothetical protein AVEN_174756-1 [Araneus ventricosus]|uniref:Uncharacterized protein n=1 Tax=Araneus ventricosus TaxID=182803 RepID=A0A4Y2BJP6_ARAVE|nr:hypothetical protein AVEN_174756-1 [Araneus ventricosus]